MNTILIYISEVLVNFIEAGLFVYLILKKIGPKARYRGKIKSINTVWTLMLVFIAISVNVLKINGTYGVLIFLTTQLIFTSWIMKGGAAEKVLWSGIYITADLSADVLAFFISSALTSKQADAVMYEYPYRFMATGSFVILLSIYVILLCRMKKKEITLPKRSIYMFTAFIVFGIIAIQAALGFCIEYSYMLSDWLLYGIYTVMALIIAIIGISIMNFINFGGVNQEKETLQQENRMLEKKIEQVSENPIYFTFKVRGMSHKINLKEVKYMNSDLRRANITMYTGEKHIFYGGLDDLIEDANELYPYFFRIGKSYAVNTIYICEHTKNSVFIDGMEFKISRKYLNSFRAMFN